MHQHPKAGARLEIAEVFRRFAAAYRDAHDLPDEQRRVLADLEHCRTKALAGHLYRCTDCGKEVVLSNSCLNRHCPTCQGPAQYRWIEERKQRLLNTPYFHVVFTLPALLRPVVYRHRRLLLDLLFASAAETLQEFAADPRRLGAQLGLTLVLHTWTRDLRLHPHIHAIVTGGGLSSDGSRWVGVRSARFLFPRKPLSLLFRRKFLHGFIALQQTGKIDLTEPDSRRLVRELKKQEWNVFLKKPFGGPAQIINYLGRYTHRVAISSSRLLSITDDAIVFRTRGENTCSLPPEEFLRRFLLHVLPHQFFKIRHYGLLAPGNVNTRLKQAQELLGPPCPDPGGADSHDADAPEPATAITDVDPKKDSTAPRCPHCGGTLVRHSTPVRLQDIAPPDTS